MNVAASFDEARAQHLKALDQAFAELRGGVADPQWCNEMAPCFPKALKALLGRLELIKGLNACQLETSK